MPDVVATQNSTLPQPDTIVNTNLQSSPSSLFSLFDFEHVAEDEPYNFVRGEVALWRAVITQALMDASNGSKKPEARYDKQQAITWLTRRSNDFDTVCYYAGLSPAYVRFKASHALSRNCKWRDDHKSSTLEFN